MNETIILLPEFYYDVFDQKQIESIKSRILYIAPIFFGIDNNLSSFVEVEGFNTFRNCECSQADYIINFTRMSSNAKWAIRIHDYRNFYRTNIEDACHSIIYTLFNQSNAYKEFIAFDVLTSSESNIIRKYNENLGNKLL